MGDMGLGAPPASTWAGPGMTMHSLEMCDPGDEENQKDFSDLKSEKRHGGPMLTWWFRACCFCYSVVGIEMAFRIGEVTCNCPAYPWHVEASLLMLQGLLSFLHDAHFAGRSSTAKYADRSCACFL